MTTNINMWAQGFTDDDKPLEGIVTTQTNPNETRTEKDAPYFAVVSYRRVTGYKYLPYTSGSESWKKAANRQLADRARANFERQTRR
jgi:hypothetical protein